MFNIFKPSLKVFWSLKPALRAVQVEQDPETVALAEQRKEARPISHIGQETNGRTKVKTKGACWNSVRGTELLWQ